jgi:hypothetical protein
VSRAIVAQIIDMTHQMQAQLERYLRCCRDLHQWPRGELDDDQPGLVVHVLAMVAPISMSMVSGKA